MLKRVRPVIKELLPPILFNAIKTLSNKEGKYGFFGDYKSWDDASGDCTGYDSEVILNKVRDALLKVKNGEAVYERDSVLFDRIQYSFPLLAGLLLAASANQNKLSVLDFGGSLGSHYFQYRNILSELDFLSWNIVEQEMFVRCGQHFFQNEQLQFYLNVESCVQLARPDVLIMSGVAAYVREPYTLTTSLISNKFKYIIFDRTAFTSNDSDRLTVQVGPPSIYQASYPAWFLSKSKFLDLFQDKYKLLVEFNSFDEVNIESEFKGFIFRKLDTY